MQFLWSVRGALSELGRYS